MPVRFVRGDLFSAKNLTAIAHGCNCAGAMGKGIALEFKRRWPAMFKQYHHLCKKKRFQLGDVFVWEEGGKTIFNLATQQSWREKADIGAIEKSLRSMVKLAEEQQISRVGLPLIGAGLGGLDWALVKDTIEHVAASTTVALVVFEAFEPNKDPLLVQARFN